MERYIITPLEQISRSEVIESDHRTTFRNTLYTYVPFWKNNKEESHKKFDLKFAKSHKGDSANE